MGDGSGTEKFFQWLDKIQPDLVMCQDVRDRKNFFKEMTARYYAIQVAGLITGSRYPLKRLKTVHRKGHWAPCAQLFEMDTPWAPVHGINVYLESPRKALEAFIWKRIKGIPDIKKYIREQFLDTTHTFRELDRSVPTLLAGDMNLTRSHKIFRKYWGDLNNAFEESGSGFGFTKFTSWHGLRLDHILFNQYWKVDSCRIGPNLGGDHRPLIATLSFKKNGVRE